MQLHSLLTANRAVSPVIGVILIVAITVILSAVIGVFMLGFGDQLQQTPRVSFSFDTTDGNQRVTATHESGDNVAGTNIDLVASTPFSWAGNATANVDTVGWETIDGAGPISAGVGVTIEAGDWNETVNDGTFAGERLTIRYFNAETGTGATLARYDAPN